MSTQNTNVETVNEIFMRVQEEETRKFKLGSKMFWQIYNLLHNREDKEYKHAMLENLQQGLRQEGIERRHFTVWRYSTKVKNANAKIVQRVEYLVRWL